MLVFFLLTSTFTIATILFKIIRTKNADGVSTRFLKLLLLSNLFSLFEVIVGDSLFSGRVGHWPLIYYIVISSVNIALISATFLYLNLNKIITQQERAQNIYTNLVVIIVSLLGLTNIVLLNFTFCEYYLNNLSQIIRILAIFAQARLIVETKDVDNSIAICMLTTVFSSLLLLPITLASNFRFRSMVMTNVLELIYFAVGTIM